MASTYLSKTPSSSGDRKTWTWSGWIKRSNLGSEQSFFGAYTGGNDYVVAQFDSDDTLNFTHKHINASGGSLSNQTKRKITNRKFRDTNAYYHIVIKFDAANTNCDIYVNGTEETSFSVNEEPENRDYAVNHTDIHYLGGFPHSVTGIADTKFDGIISHVHLCDGYAYTPSNFGSTDATTGEWKINTAPSVSYGTNGYFLLKDGNSVTDQSGQGNNYSVAAGTLTNTEDSPSNVFCTMNPLNHDYAYTDTDIGAGNTFVYPRANANYNYAVSTLAMPKGNGKFYAEAKYITYDTVTAGVGIVDMDYVSEIFYQNRNLPEQTNSTYIGRVIYLKNGYSIIPSTENNSYGSSYANGDIIQIACDMENGAIYFGKNGTWQNSGDPTSGASKTGAIDISAQSWYTGTTHWGFWCGDKATNHDRFAWNFGNGNFASASGSFGSQTYSTTAVSSAGSNASGIGIFEYDVPTGYTALSTKGLNE